MYYFCPEENYNPTFLCMKVKCSVRTAEAIMRNLHVNSALKFSDEFLIFSSGLFIFQLILFLSPFQSAQLPYDSCNPVPKPWAFGQLPISTEVDGTVKLNLEKNSWKKKMTRQGYLDEQFVKQDKLKSLPSPYETPVFYPTWKLFPYCGIFDYSCYVKISILGN